MACCTAGSDKLPAATHQVLRASHCTPGARAAACSAMEGSIRLSTDTDHRRRRASACRHPGNAAESPLGLSRHLRIRWTKDGEHCLDSFSASSMLPESGQRSSSRLQPSTTEESRDMGLQMPPAAYSAATAACEAQRLN